MKNQKNYTFTNDILKYIIIFNISFCFLSSTSAQQFKLINGTIYTCSGKITDTGGLSGPYGKNEKFTTIICSDNPQYSLLQLAFTSSDIKNGDDLCIYDGIGVGSPLLTCSSDHNNFPFVVQTTKSNPAGCLTLQFNSNNFIQGSGFSADISCKPVCQEVTASILNSGGLVSTQMDICPGEKVVLKGNAIFPQNDQKYHQDLKSCSFDWYLDNKFFASSDSVVLPIYESGGHLVNLVMTDSLGCKSQNLALQKIRVSPQPDFIEGSFKTIICKDEQLDLSTSIPLNNNFDISLKENYGTFPKKDIIIDSLALPDGTGQSFSSVLFIGRFDPNEIIDESSDLEQVCINLEHSFLNDLEITLTCPNGQKIILQDQTPATGIVYLGEPVENDEILPEPIPGKGYEYCWKMNANNGTWTDFIVKNNPKTLPSGTYTPFQSFDNLLGCPMAGLWTITVNDLWNSDNGYVFHWSLEFDPSLYPPVDSFTNQITSGLWLDNPALIGQSSSGMSLVGAQAGNIEQVWQVTDEKGCTFEHPVNIEVLPDMHPDCKNCKLELVDLKEQTICPGDMVNLDAEILPSGFITNINFSNISAEKNLASTLLNFKIPVTTYNFPPSIFMQDLINSVCLSVSATDLEKVTISLVSPDLKEIDLIKSNSIQTNSIINTCFTPVSTSLINSGSGSYTGVFRPADDFSILKDCVVKGNWSIKVKKPLDDVFILSEAKIDFKINNKLHYKWTGQSGLDCDTCKSASGTFNQNSTVSLIVKDDYLCLDSSLINIKIQNSFPAPLVFNQLLPNGSIIFSWGPVQGASNYEISINDQAWIAPNGNLSHIVTGLLPGTVVVFKIRVNENGKNCQNEIAEVMVSYTDCGILSFLEISHESCLGTGDGNVKINVTQGNGPFLFSLNNGSPTSSNTFDNLTSGWYSLIISDSKLCKDTIDFEIQTSIPISINKVVEDVSCFGGNNGKASLNVIGGFAPYDFTWSNGSSNTNLVDMLSAGKYEITITDAKKCSIIETITINQPKELFVAPIISESPCHGQSNASIDLQISGGTSPYNFVWFDGSVLPAKNNLMSGSYFVKVVDNNGCIVEKDIFVSEPESITYNTKFSNPSCFGFNDGWLEVSPMGGTSPYAYVWTSNPSIVGNSITGLTSGSYSVSLTDVNGCSLTGTFTLTDPPKLAATIVSTDEICPGDKNGKAELNVVSGNGPFIYTWSNGNTSLVGSINQLQPGGYQVTVSNVNGCTIQLPFEIKNAVPFTGYIDAPLLACQNLSSGVATAVVTSGVPPYSFEWNDPLNQTGSQASSLAQGNYSVKITDSRACELILDTQIKANNPISLISNLLKPTSCSGLNDGSAELLCEGGKAPYSIQWSGGLPNSFIQNNLNKGKYQYLIKDSLGCELTGEIEITSPEPLNIDALIKDVACKYESTGKIDLLLTGGVAPYSTIWNNGSSFNSIQNLAAGNYFLTITDKNNCVQTKTFVVNEPNLEFKIEATQNQISCYAKNEGIATVEMVLGSGTINQILWSNLSSGKSIDNLATGYYSVTASDTYGCIRFADVNIVEWQPLEVNYKIDSTSCFESLDGKVEILQIKGGAGNGTIDNYAINWNLPGTNGNPIVNGIAGGQYLNISVKDQQGCEYLGSINMPITPALTYELKQSNPVCFQGQDGKLMVMNVAGGNAPYTLVWNNGDSGFDIGSLSSGEYIGSLTDAKGCNMILIAKIEDPSKISAKSTFIVHPKCSYDSDGSINCAVTGGNAPYSYLWKDGKMDQKLENLVSGIYSLTITDQSGCTAIETFNLNSTNQIEANTEVLSAACFDQYTGSVAINVTQGKQPFQYSLDGSNFNSDNFIDQLGPGLFSVVVKDTDGCTETLNFEITSAAKFDVEELGDVTVEYGNSIELKPEINQTAPVLIKWNTINVGKISCDTCHIISFIPQQTGNVWLNITDDQGCTKKMQVNVRVIKDYQVFVPTAFSPNFDGVNDYLAIFGKDNIQVSDFKVFDQWGEMIFSNDDPILNLENKGWDGSFKGKPMNSGVFIWVLKADFPDGTSEIISGETTLLR